MIRERISTSTVLLLAYTGIFFIHTIVAAPQQNCSDFERHLPQEHLINEITLWQVDYSGERLAESRCFSA